MPGRATTARGEPSKRLERVCHSRSWRVPSSAHARAFEHDHAVPAVLPALGARSAGSKRPRPSVVERSASKLRTMWRRRSTRELHHHPLLPRRTFRLVGNVDPLVGFYSCTKALRHTGDGATPRELLNDAKSSIREVDATGEAELGRHLPRRARADEYEQVRCQERCTPRGNLEFQVEGKLLDKSPCGRLLRSGVRSAFATKTWGAWLHRRVSLIAGSTSGRTKASPGHAPDPHPSSATATSATCSCPRWRERPAEAARLEGAAPRRRRTWFAAALYLAAAGVGTIGIIDMDVVDASNLQRQILHNMERIGDRKVDSAKKTLTAMNPTSTWPLRRAPRCRQRARHHRRLRRDRRRTDNFRPAIWSTMRRS